MRTKGEFWITNFIRVVDVGRVGSDKRKHIYFVYPEIGIDFITKSRLFKLISFSGIERVNIGMTDRRALKVSGWKKDELIKLINRVVIGNA